MVATHANASHELTQVRPWQWILHRHPVHFGLPASLRVPIAPDEEPEWDELMEDVHPLGNAPALLESLARAFEKKPDQRRIAEDIDYGHGRI